MVATVQKPTGITDRRSHSELSGSQVRAECATSSSVGSTPSRSAYLQIAAATSRCSVSAFESFDAKSYTSGLGGSRHGQ